MLQLAEKLRAERQGKSQKGRPSSGGDSQGPSPGGSLSNPLEVSPAHAISLTDTASPCSLHALHYVAGCMAAECACSLSDTASPYALHALHCVAVCIMDLVYKCVMWILLMTGALQEFAC